MVRIVISRARHTAEIGARKGYFTAYLALKGCVKPQHSLCADSASVLPSYLFRYTRQSNWEPATDNVLNDIMLSDQDKINDRSGTSCTY
jgi:hypothetical protein